MNGDRVVALDWLKAAGIAIIVWGHVIGVVSLNTVSPILIKQFGVAFFVFVTGFTVAVDRRPWKALVARRLFEPWFFGLATALLMSAIALVRIHTLQKSNYVPFAAGINVFFNFFPANPTTWFLGCYLHILLAAAWMRKFRWTWGQVALVGAAEILIRTALLTTGRLFMAYMLLPNWTAALALGFAISRNRSNPWRLLAGGGIGLLVGLAVRPHADAGFPFLLPARPDLLDLFRTSAAVTCLYGSATVLVYGAAAIARWTPRLVALIARHTLLIFLLHMPLYYVLPEAITGQPRTFVHGLECFVILMVVPLAVSLAVFRLFNPEALRRRIVPSGEVAAH